MKNQEVEEVVAEFIPIQGLENLRHGDLSKLAIELNVHKQTVYSVASGKYFIEWIHEAIVMLISIRKEQAMEAARIVANKTN
jgi:hypothetical protein